MTSISANLKTYERAFILQITDQTPDVEQFLKSNGQFIASNGWTVTHNVCPEVDVNRKIIYLRGVNTDRKLRTARVWDLSSDSKAQSLVNQIDSAIQEFVGAVDASNRSPRIAPFGWTSTPISSESKNYKSNKNTITA